MKTNLSMEAVKRCILATAKKFSTIEAKILLNKDDYRNVALMVEAESKGSKLASEGSEKLTKNVCDHVMIEFIKQVTKEKGWVQMHDGKVFGTEVKEGKEANVINANENLCYCNHEKPVKKEVEKKIEKKVTKKDLAELAGRAKTLDGVLSQENKSQNKKQKNEIFKQKEIQKGIEILKAEDEIRKINEKAKKEELIPEEVK